MENEVKALRTDMKACLRIVKKNKSRIIKNTMLLTFIGMIVVVVMSFTTKDMYSASAVVYGSYEKSVAGYNVVEDYSTIATSYNVCSRALAILGYKDTEVEDIRKIISFEIGEDSTVLTIYAEADSPEKATQIAKAVAQAFVAEVNYMTNMDAASVLDEISEVSRTSSAKKTLVIVQVLFCLVGFLGTSLVIMFKAITSKKILSIEECTMNGELEIIGILPNYERI